ncbi:MAG TPA: cupredoxin domain-containing protein [Actinomycetota bacterium]|jgi:plastocyanin
MLFRMVRITAAVAVALGVLTACGGGTSTAPPAATPQASAPGASATPTPPSGPTVEIVEEDFKFVPATFAIRTDQGPVVQNKGASLHNISITGTVVDIDTQPGQTTSLEAIGGALKPGTYEFFCKYHKGQGMTGTVTVVQGQSGSSSGDGY